MIYARLHPSRWSPRSPPLLPNFWLGTWSRPPDRPSQVALAAAIALLVVALVPGGPRWLATLLEVTGAAELRRRRRFLFIASFIAAFLSLGYIAFYLRGGPRAPEAATYWLQGRALSHGHLAWTVADPTASFRTKNLLLTVPDRLAGIFPPGYALLLGAAFLLGAPMLVGPLLAAALVPATWFLARELAVGAGAGRRPRGVDGADRRRPSRSSRRRCGTTPPSRCRKGAAAAALTVALASALRARRTGDSRLFAVAGLALGLLLATQPMSALGTGIAIVTLALLSRDAASRWPPTSRLGVRGGAAGPRAAARGEPRRRGARFRVARLLLRRALRTGVPPHRRRQGRSDGRAAPPALERRRRGEFRAHRAPAAAAAPPRRATPGRARRPAGGRDRRLSDLPRGPGRRRRGHLPRVRRQRAGGCAAPRARAHRACAGARDPAGHGSGRWSRRRSRSRSPASPCTPPTSTRASRPAASAARTTSRTRPARRARRTACSTSTTTRATSSPTTRAPPRATGSLAVRTRGDDHDRLLFDLLGRPPTHRHVSGRSGPSVSSWTPNGGDTWRFEAEADFPPVAASDPSSGRVEVIDALGTCASDAHALALVPVGAAEASVTLELPVPRGATAAPRRTWVVTPRAFQRGGPGQGEVALVGSLGGPPLARWSWTDATRGGTSCSELPGKPVELGGDIMRAWLVVTARGGAVALDRTMLRAR